jgi:hypothetical protein
MMTTVPLQTPVCPLRAVGHPNTEVSAQVLEPGL